MLPNRVVTRARPEPTILDGAMGTELARRGACTEGPFWSARALLEQPELVAAIHADHAVAGATVHTANTFRTSPWWFERHGRHGESESWTRRAVDLAREHVPVGHLVAGSVAPLQDCWEPDAAPPAAVARPAHLRHALQLRDAGVDFLLLETFTALEEALVALDAGLSTGLPCWFFLSAGPSGDLAEPAALRDTLVRAAHAGAAVVGVNCSPRAFGSWAADLREMLPASVGFGLAPNLGVEGPDGRWQWAPDESPDQLRRWAGDRWRAGVDVVGGCCGTTPLHLAGIAEGCRGAAARAVRDGAGI